MAMIGWLASINLLVLVFNLLPAFPMDGGRIVRAIAWWRTGDRNSATRFAANLGRVFAYLFIGGGLLLIASGDAFGGIWLALIGIVINGSARAASMQTAITGKISDLRVADVMDREPVAIPGELSVEQALDEYFLRYRWPWFPVVDAAHRFLGLVVRDKADEVPETSRATSHVSDLLEHDDGTFQVRDDAPLDSLLANRALRRFGAVMAVDIDGRLSGVITAGAGGPGSSQRREVAVGPGRGPRLTLRWGSSCLCDGPMALDDAAEVGAGGERAEGVAPVAGEAAGAEGVGHCLVAVADKEGCL